MQLQERGAPALIYNYGPQWKQGAPEDRRRCRYIFPFYTPAGVSMLDDFPQDHFHHRGLFLAWPVVETGGKTYDLWMNMTVKHHAVKALGFGECETGGAARGRFVAGG
jgi:Methane oxygenase PmoA